MKISNIRRGFFWTAAATLAVLVVTPTSLTAQSLFAGRGLGFVGEPLDARARGLGGVGLGLPEASLSLINPAEVGGIPASTLHVTVQPNRFSAEIGDDVSSGGTVRFPLIHAALPFRRWTASIGYAAFLDRNWSVQRDTLIQLDGRFFQVSDRFASRGGAARLRLGGAYGFDERLSVGAAVDVYTGSATDSTYRAFLDQPLRPSVERQMVSFSGMGYGAGARWRPSEAFAISGAVNAGGQLNMTPELGEGERRSFDLPLQLSVGLSGRVTPTTLVALSGNWAGWSSVDDALEVGGGARDVWALGGGIEWEAIRAGTRVVPVRLGARRAGLPFRWNDAGIAGDWADERAVTLGAGLRMAGGGATIDAAVDRGDRGGAQAGISESFWRISLSLTVLGR
jgi:hypothetical protein